MIELAELTESLKQLPVIRTWMDRRHVAHFLSEEGFAASYGVFSSFAEARAWLPTSKEFDQPVLSAEYVRIRMHRVFPYDAPILHWLDQAFRGGATSILDIGGSVGVHYYGYKDRLSYPAALQWRVFEVPAITQIGREIAARTGAKALSFVETLAPQDLDTNIWLTSGAIQYIETAQPDALLSKCRRLPTHILFNKIPLYDGEDFVAAQNIGEQSFAPYFVYGRRQFVLNIERFGYRLIASWAVPERSLYLPGHPEKSFSNFSGLYFSLEGNHSTH